jgi:hypothetical protein
MFALALVLAMAAPAPLSFADLFDAGATLKPSARVLSLDGRRVRIEGFMAQMEMPPQGAFWLCRTPVFGDEAGGGTADLPPERVLVTLTPSGTAEIKPIRAPIRVEGRLEVGRKVARDGTLSHFRIVLDPHRNIRPSSAASKERK